MKESHSDRQHLAAIFKTFASEAIPQPADIEAVLPSLKGLKAVIFDVYGTLFQSAVGDISLIDKSPSASREEAICEVLDLAGLIIQVPDFNWINSFSEMIKTHQQREKEIGTLYPEVDIVSVWNEWIESLLENSIIEKKSPDNLIDLEKVAIEYEARVNPVFPMPGTEELIDFLNTNGILLGIVSNAQFFTMLLFDAFFDKSFADMGFAPDACVWSFDQLKAKPGTDLYEICANTLKLTYGILPSEALFVGNDLRNDVWPAQLVGFKTALFAGDTQSYRPRIGDKDTQGVKPDVVLTDLLQIKDLF